MKRARTTGARPTSSPTLVLTAVLSAGLILGLSAAEAAKSKGAAAEADQLIKTGVEALESGRVDLAVQELTSAITGGISQSKLARALYYRGLAYRKQKKPAQAIADLTSALWIKNGLDAEQRADALLNRAAAYRDAGLTDQAEADEKRVAASRQAAATRSASAGSRQAAPAAPAPSSSSGGGLGSFFSTLFGGAPAQQESTNRGFATSVSASGPRDGQPTASRRSPSASAWSSRSKQSDPATAGWADSTVVRKASATSRGRGVPETTASTGRSSGGGQFVQVAAVRSREEAQAVATRLSRMGATAGERDAAIEETVVGNMGTLYRVRLGPFASAEEAQSICPRLRNAGLDCLEIGR